VDKEQIGMIPIHYYYHVYADGAWEDAVKEHTDALRNNGLGSHLTSFLTLGSLEVRKTRSGCETISAANTLIGT
jgi:hypothetical protein